MITVQGLTKVYGDRRALDSVSFSVPAGQICGYLGPNGAGKTTTVRMLTGILAPTEGTASVGGFDVVASPLEVKKRIGYVPESSAVYPTLSVNEYLALVGALHALEPHDVADRADRMLGLLKIADAADQRLDTLSKGIQRKVVICAALLPTRTSSSSTSRWGAWTPTPSAPSRESSAAWPSGARPCCTAPISSRSSNASATA
ncbi:MAG: ABC transporter ATP-binding protein [Planctomycetes bacterium]|nr:ABC transporter ATP-binding protein [Planctomycetota bacterium]